MSFDTDTNSYENQLPSIQRIQSAVETRYGRSFASPIVGVDVEDFQDGIGHGTFDYQSRTLKINRTKLLDISYSPEEVLEHEATHILERDILGNDPIHAHIIHATFIPSERSRLVGMSGIRDDQLSFKKLFGDQFKIDISESDGITKENILLIENELKKILQKKDLSQREQVITTVVAMDLDLIKTAYLSEAISKIDPQLVFEFEKAIQQLEPQRLLANTSLYSFEDEIAVLVKVIQSSKAESKE